jgi:hypothetical protein
LHFFSEIYIVNLTLTTSETALAMKVSPIRKKMRGFIEVSLNFYPFIDTIYTVNRTKTSRDVNFIEGLTSYLLSLPKFHEFQISFSKGENLPSLAASLEEALGSKLGVLERHGSSQYKESGSPRMNVLLLDRKLDAMSPLLYSYFYGPIAHELELLG